MAETVTNVGETFQAPAPSDFAPSVGTKIYFAFVAIFALGVGFEVLSSLRGATVHGMHVRNRDYVDAALLIFCVPVYLFASYRRSKAAVLQAQTAREVAGTLQKESLTLALGLCTWMLLSSGFLLRLR